MTTTTTQERPVVAEHGRAVQAGAFSPRQLWAATPEALRKLDPRAQMRNPVMFVVWVGSVVVTVSAIVEPSAFSILIAIWLWLTVLFANLAEAVAEGRGKAQAESLRATKRDTVARRLDRTGTEENVPGTALTIGDLVVVEAGETIPGDGDVVEGIATVDESAITGESAPVIREAGGDRSGGHRRHHGAVGPDRRQDHDEAGRVVRGPDDRAGRGRRLGSKTPNEIALTILLAGPDDHLRARRGGAAAHEPPTPASNSR